MIDKELIIERWRSIRQRIEILQHGSPAAAHPVNLVAVSKAQPAEAILPLLAAGQRAFGENRVQEAAAKWPPLIARYPDTELHLIGSLQTNKVKEALSLFNVIHTIDRESLVDAIIKESYKLPVASCRQFFVQVNTGEESQKGGVLPRDFPRLMDYIRSAMCNLQRATFTITGLMCVPPAGEFPAPHFALLHKLARESGIANLSMGMSGDYETAIRLGATHVRVGTALFGERG